MTGVPEAEDRKPAGRLATLAGKTVLNRSFAGLLVLTLLSGAACYLGRGGAAVAASVANDFGLIALVVPKLGAAFLVGGFVQVLLPRDAMARWIGEHSGLSGIALASGAGMVTPGGPMTSFPLVCTLHEAGTGRGPLVAYLTAWATLGFQRIVIWEIPIMGLEFTALRVLVSLPLPIIAGLIARLPARRMKAGAPPLNASASPSASAP